MQGSFLERQSHKIFTVTVKVSLCISINGNCSNTYWLSVWNISLKPWGYTEDSHMTQILCFHMLVIHVMTAFILIIYVLLQKWLMCERCWSQIVFYLCVCWEAYHVCLKWSCFKYLIYLTAVFFHWTNYKFQSKHTNLSMVWNKGDNWGRNKGNKK